MWYSQAMLLPLLLMMQSAEEPPSTVTVTGTRERREATLGSRIGRARKDFGNGQIATATGVAGLTPRSGMDPFAGPTKAIEVKECRGDKPLTREALCALADAQNLIVKGDLDQARAVLFRIEDSPASGPPERLAAAQFIYRIAELKGDSALREEALEQMLDSAAMSGTDRLAALRTLVSLALKRQDQSAAIARLRRLLAEAPGDARSLANLAALHAGRGEHQHARPLMHAAVAASRASGETPPVGWTDYLRSQRD